MGLVDYHIERATVKAGNTTITVRGITGADVMLAVQDYGPALALAYGQISMGQMDQFDAKKTILAIAREVPEAVGAVIALASDEYVPEAVEKAGKLPIPITVELLQAIFGLTFKTEADVKKLLESLTEIMRAMSGALEAAGVSLPSQSGIGESAAA
jgi:hypothetical protein